MCEQCSRNVQGQTAEKNGEHEDPFEVLKKRGEESVCTETIAESCERDIAEAGEDDYDGEPRLLLVGTLR
jgi:hypothetical protein